MPEAPTLLPPVETRGSQAPSRRYFWVAAAIIAFCGILLRIVPSAGFKSMGFDEALYRSYVEMLDKKGPGGYMDVFDLYLADQSKSENIAKLPPSRVGYIFAGWLWKRMEFGGAPSVDLRSPGNIERDPVLVSLHRVACLFSILLLLAAGIATTRMLGREAGIGVLALMSCGPLPLHMSQHALIDGVFAFWATLAMWSLWECLRQPDRAGWLTLYGISLAFLVLTKENAFFVFCALLGLMIVNRWVGWGRITPKLLLVSIAAPLAGVAVLVVLAGGLPTLLDTFRVFVSKANQLEYAIKTGDGPWHRYLIDLLIVSPLILSLALAGIFHLPGRNRELAYAALFVVLTYILMCNVRYGMSLRFATIWDVPLRMIAFGQIAWLAQKFGSRAKLLLMVAVAGVCAYELHQYSVFFSDAALYDLPTEGLLRAVSIIK